MIVVGPYARLTFDAGDGLSGLNKFQMFRRLTQRETYEPTNDSRVYHKQRISYVHIKQTCQNLQGFLLLFSSLKKRAIKARDKKWERPFPL